MTGARLVVWDDEACWRVHEATLALLEETGVAVPGERARALLVSAGASADGDRVRLPHELVDEAIKAAPRRFELKGRGAAPPLEIADGLSFFGTGPDCLYVRDPETGERRRATLDDVEGMAALCERLPAIDFVMSMGSPADAPAGDGDLARFAAMLAGTRKPLIATARAAASLPRMVELAEACGEAASFACYALSSPPLQHGDEAVRQIVACAELGVPLVYAPAPVAGETAPASIGATVLIGNAEVLSALVLHQLVQPGAPFVLGVGCGAMDPASAIEVFGAPELYLGNAAACDLCHFYGLPSFAYAAVSDAKALDEQWAAEAGISAVLGALSRATLLHDVGYLEAGLQSSFETIVLGHELVLYARALMHEVGVDSESLALNEIAAVGPGGRFAGRAYTTERQQGFWSPSLFERGVFDNWQAGGATTLRERVRERTEALRGEPRAFALGVEARSAVDAALAAQEGVR